ncbi:MAG: ADP-ribosylglycohydrolase family protein [Bacilli bacterium]|nr:ADP-ribosylglycohydrolase family protein [Bacilli bacterium]
MKHFKGSYYGFIVGDAMGVPLEFEERRKLLENPVTKMEGNRSYDVPKGSWSDDSSMMIATMDSIISKSEIDYDDLMSKFSEWISYSKYTAVDEVFDIGRTTLRAIVRFQDGISSLECGLEGENYNGNGSLMRMIPIAFYASVKELCESDIIDLVFNVSSLTHRHEISKLGCYIFVRYVMFLLDGFDKYKSYELIKKLDYSFVPFDVYDRYARVLKENIMDNPVEEIKSSSYVIDTLEAVLWCVGNTSNFSTAIIGSINLGGDTDTIGALTGSIAGIIYGYDDIPKDWLGDLQKQDYLKLMYNGFIKAMSNLKK